MIVLAGDVGGTNARLALVDIAPQSARVLHLSNYSSPAFTGLTPIIQLFLQQTGASPDRACFGVPGPVIDGRCRTPNLAWLIDAGELASTTGIGRVGLINDFAAVGYGVGVLQPEDIVTLQKGNPRPFGQMVLIGAGTGLGVGFRFFDGQHWRVAASEGGHALFAPRDAAEWGLAEWLRREYRHASWERVVSGPGLVNIYRYLLSAGMPESTEVKAEMAAGDPGAAISRHGLTGSDPVCRRALEMFVSCYGAAAGNYGVVGMATGGVYLAGGIAPRLLDIIQSGLFLDSFHGHDAFRDITAQLPVHVIIRPDVGVLGAALAAFDAT